MYNNDYKKELALNKQSLLGILSAVVLVLIGLGGFFVLRDNSSSNDTSTAPAEQSEQQETPEAEESVPDTDLSSKYLKSYEITDTSYDTQITVVVDEQAGTRSITSNALPNHETGEFPTNGNPNTISAQNKSWSYTTDPTFVGTATEVRESGVSINGVKFEPGTAERATCSSGEVYSIEAIQEVVNLGLDFNNAHVQPTGEYHYHGVSEMMVEAFTSDQDLIHVGFAADGHLIYYSKSNAYKPGYATGSDNRVGTNCSYTGGGPNGQTVEFGAKKDGSLDVDWEHSKSRGDLDECNGATVAGQYIYLITNDYPYIPRCMMGQVAEGPRGPQ